MKQKGNALIIVLILVIVLGVVGYFVYKNMKLKQQTSLVTSPSPSSKITPTPVLTASPSPTSNVPAGWKLYQNTQYGFEFSYPVNYKVLTDSENLYGWPNAILLLYDGGQSYDLPVELWNTEAEYKTKYTDSSTYTVYKTKDGKFITLSNMNKDPEVVEIISTFKFTD